MDKYIYDGPVMAFNQVVTDKWYGETMAVSERKARTNLIFQFKQQHGKMPGAKISLPGEIIKIGMEGWEQDE